MSKYIEYFNLASDVEGYYITGLPFSGYVDETNEAIFYLNIGVIIDGQLNTDYTCSYNAAERLSNNPFGDCLILQHIDLAGNNRVVCVDRPITSISTTFRATGLTSIKIPDSVTSIERNAFSGSTFESITIPENVRLIGRSVFRNCNIQSLQWNAVTCTLRETNSTYPMFSSSVKTVTFGDKVKSIPAYLCYGMSNLTSVTIPDNVTDIKDYAFNHCGVTSIIIPENIVHIGSNAFRPVTSVLFNAINCSCMNSYEFSSFKRLSSISFGDKVLTIPEFICVSATISSVVLPASVINIKNGAFYECYSLKSITCLASTPPTLGGSNSLSGVTAVYVPAESVEAYKTATNWSYYASKIQAIP